MVKRGLIGFLEEALGHAHEDLLILAVTFLKKLCVYAENKDAFIEGAGSGGGGSQQDGDGGGESSSSSSSSSSSAGGVIARLGRFVPCSSAPLVVITLRLLFNLAFDPVLREQMLKTGLVPKLVALLKSPPYRARGVRLLYLLSVDDRCKAMVTYADGIPLVMGLIVNFPQPVSRQQHKRNSPSFLPLSTPSRLLFILFYLF